MASGIGDFFNPEFESMPKNRVRTLKDFLPLFASEPLLFEPGAKHQYSNGGYIVLGAIVEKVSGQDYYRYVREHIFMPAGMQNTDWYEADTPTPNLANGYTREGVEDKDKTVRRNNFYTRPAKGSSAGGGYSTAEDLLKFTQALQARKLRVPEFRGPDSPGAQLPAGYVGIAGGSPGVNALLVSDPETGYTVIVMSNYDPPSAEKVGKQIRAWLANVKH
jgi:CubicO group peptidase (beta-lactamase class C family)